MWSSIANFKDNLSQIAADVLDTADELKRGGRLEDDEYEDESYDDSQAATSQRSRVSEKDADLKAEVVFSTMLLPFLNASEYLGVV
jgi:hypothetical protein